MSVSASTGGMIGHEEGLEKVLNHLAANIFRSETQKSLGIVYIVVGSENFVFLLDHVFPSLRLSPW